MQKYLTSNSGPSTQQRGTVIKKVKHGISREEEKPIGRTSTIVKKETPGSITKAQPTKIVPKPSVLVTKDQEEKSK